MRNLNAVALGAVVLMVLEATIAAQTEVGADLRPVEDGRWEASLASPVRDRICLNPSAYVVVGRVESGYGAAIGLVREGDGMAGLVAGFVIGDDDGKRWTWDVFETLDRQCFDVAAVVTEGGSSRDRRVVRVQLYMLRVGVNW